MELKLNQSLVPFNLTHTLDCGQLFRWKKLGDWWYGIVGNRIIKIKQNDDNTLNFHFHPETANNGFIEKYLRLDDDLPLIFSKITKDKMIKKAIKQFFGLRLIRQEPWECLISYICATFKGIPAIKKMIYNISKCFGEKLIFDGYEFYTFPRPNRLAQVNQKNLRECGLGFRAKRVVETAKIIDSEKISLDELKSVDYYEAKSELLSLPGVGQKVSDCVLLFSLEKLEAFPIDIWIKRAITNLYPRYFDSSFIKRIEVKGSITSKEYETIGSFGREYFGEYAGYAQEYLFHFLRTRNLS
jgi:N-glycosylase/DNA lyase